MQMRRVATKQTFLAPSVECLQSAKGAKQLI